MSTALKTIAERLLGEVLDDPEANALTDGIAEEILGRAPNQPAEEDEAWWEAKTTAVDHLLHRMASLNSGRSDQ
jgi:hypothetical protein